MHLGDLHLPAFLQRQLGSQPSAVRSKTRKVKPRMKKRGWRKERGHDRERKKRRQRKVNDDTNYRIQQHLNSVLGVTGLPWEFIGELTGGAGTAVSSVELWKAFLPPRSGEVKGTVFVCSWTTLWYETFSSDRDFGILNSIFLSPSATNQSQSLTRGRLCSQWETLQIILVENHS